jgi:DNA-binding transcriptional LysR family regulator
LPAGRLFKDYAERILQTYNHASQVLARLPETIVMVSASEDVFDYLVNDLLVDFLELHSEVSFQRAFLAEHDLKIVLKSEQTKRGMLTLSYHPSSEFSRTRLWSVLSLFLEPTL